jgi:glycosyltransferase involved in cell wall biosynthesis
VALNTGFRKAVELSPDVVVTIDADGQHLPDELPAVASPVLNGEADLVIGSRYLEDRSDVPKRRVFGHRIFNWITKAASGTSTSDSQSGYRAFSPKALQKISFSSDSFSVESEMQFIATQHDLRLREVPITILYKDAPKRSLLRHGVVVLNGILRLVGQYRPLLFFGLPGVLIMFFGFGWALYVVEIFSRTRELAVGYAILSVMLSVIGMVGFATGIILHSVRSLITDLMGSKNK